MTCSSTGCSAVPSWTVPVSAAAIASAGVAVRTTRLRALRAIAGSMTVQLPRSRSSGAALVASWSISSSVSGSPCTASCQRKLNSSPSPKTPVRSWASRSDIGRDRSSTVLAVSSRPRLRGHRTSTPRAARAATPVSSRLASSSPSRVIWSGTRSSSSRSSTGQRLGRTAQRDRGMGARPVAEAVLLRVGGPQHRGVAEVQGVLLVVDLEDQPHRAGDQLILVGLHPQRDPHQLGQLRPRLGVALEPFAQPLLEPGRLTGARRSAVGAARGMASATASSMARTTSSASSTAEPVVRPRRGQAQDAVLVVGRQRPHPPARLAAGRLDLARRDQPQPEQRRPGQQPDAGVQVVAAVRLGQHRQRGPDRQRDRAPFVGELDDPLARRLERRGTSPCR